MPTNALVMRFTSISNCSIAEQVKFALYLPLSYLAYKPKISSLSPLHVTNYMISPFPSRSLHTLILLFTLFLCRPFVFSPFSFPIPHFPSSFLCYFLRDLYYLVLYQQKSLIFQFHIPSTDCNSFSLSCILNHY